MPKTTRRQFLQTAGAAALAASTPAIPSALSAPALPDAPERSSIPPHRALDLPGIHAYADAHSVAAGGDIRFYTSSTAPYQLSIHRLGPLIDDPSGDLLLKSFPPSPPAPQPIHPGSYVFIEKGLRRPLPALALECWTRPWQLSQLQGLLSQEDKEDSRGFALGLGKDGYAGFYLGDGISPDDDVIHRTPAGQVQLRRWHHLVAQWDGAFKEIWVNGVRAGRWPFTGQCQPGPHPLRLGAMAEKGRASFFLDGDLAMPVIYKRALSPEEIQHRFAAKGAPPALSPAILACWPLAEERGEQIADLSRHKRRGRIINHATWMIGGPAFDADQVPRFGHYNPKSDPARGRALRFASDDLYDCRWRETHRWRVPATARPGVYVARLQFTPEGKTEPENYHVTFLVRKAPSRRPAPILVLCSTSTWLAYNAAPFSLNIPPGTFLNTGGYKNSHPEAPAFSCYLNHRHGQPSYQFGTRVPWPCAGPYILYSSKETGYSHLMRAERFLHVWLEKSGYDYDIASDFDLHRDPDLPRQYKTVILNGHSEYWSIPAYLGLDRYLRQGGTSIVLSGNTLFWRTSFNADGSIMECRKYDERIGGRGGAALGELYHSHDGQRGSLLREIGFPAWKLVGLECAGWNGVEAKDAGVYHPAALDHFLFHQPEKVGLGPGDTFGHSPDGASHKAVGHEYDVRVSTLLRMTRQIPLGASVPREPSGITTLALGKRPARNALDYFTNPTETPDNVLAEMIYWERPEGGRVFHAGAIGAGWALSVDPKLQTLLRNVLHAFGVTPG